MYSNEQHLSLRKVLLTGGALLAAACSSVDPALKDPGSGREIADLEPAPFRVGVRLAEASFGAVSTADGERSLPMPEGAALQALFQEAFDEQGLSSDVRWLNNFEATDEGWRSINGEEIDMVAVLALRPGNYRYEGVSSNWPATLGLWVLTWAGSLFVSDTEYEVALDCDLELWDPRTKERVSQGTLESSSTELSFFERNPVLSKGFFISMLVPSFWTPDQGERLSESLVKRAAQHLSAGTKLALLEAGEGESVVLNPGTGHITSAAQETFFCRVDCEDEVRDVEFFCNGIQVDVDVYDALNNQVQTDEGRYELQCPGEIPLSPGPNFIRILVTLDRTSEDQISRTFRWQSTRQDG